MISVQSQSEGQASGTSQPLPQPPQSLLGQPLAPVPEEGAECLKCNTFAELQERLDCIDGSEEVMRVFCKSWIVLGSVLKGILRAWQSCLTSWTLYLFKWKKGFCLYKCSATTACVCRDFLSLLISICFQLCYKLMHLKKQFTVIVNIFAQEPAICMSLIATQVTQVVYSYLSTLKET